MVYIINMKGRETNLSPLNQLLDFMTRQNAIEYRYQRRGGFVRPYFGHHYELNRAVLEAAVDTLTDDQIRNLRQAQKALIMRTEKAIAPLFNIDWNNPDVLIKGSKEDDRTQTKDTVNMAWNLHTKENYRAARDAAREYLREVELPKFTA